jgi:hypothetical protein
MAHNHETFQSGFDGGKIHCAAVCRVAWQLQSVRADSESGAQSRAGRGNFFARSVA